MSEIACTNCVAACCKGDPLLVMQLTKEELSFMARSGNQFQKIESPKPYDRDDVRYPIGARINPGRRTLNFMYKASSEYEPLPANYGRYALIGACKYLATDDNGWEYCSVYDERPGACQDFEMGGEKCQLIRTLKQVSPPA